VARVAYGEPTTPLELLKTNDRRDSDLLNRANFDVPNRVAFTPNFGRIFSAKPARQMQFGVKFLSSASTAEF
jgi:hypothetical protein